MHKSLLLRLIISICAVLVSYKGQSQTCEYQLEGYIYDIQTNDPLPFVTILIENTSIGTVSDEQGYFQITGLCSEEVHLMFNYVGYKTHVHHHDPFHPEPKIFLAPDDVLLESITVEGELIDNEFVTMSSSSLSYRDISLNQQRSMGEMTARLSGVSTISTGQNIVKPVIHGLHSNRILIINNELRHEYQNWGIEHAPEIDASMIDQLEVIKGAASVKYGPDALGGVIKIKSRLPSLHDGVNSMLQIGGSSNGRGGEVSGQVSYGGERIASSLRVNYQQMGDLQTPEYQLTNTGMKEYGASGSFLFHDGKLDIEGQVSHTYQQLGILRASVTGNLNDLVFALEKGEPTIIAPFDYTINPPFQEVAHTLGRVKGIYRWNDQEISLQYGLQHNQRKEIDVRRGSSSLIPSIDLELTTHSLDAEWVLPIIDGWNLSVGSQSMIQDNNNIPGTNTVPFVPNFNNYRTGIYGIASRQMSVGLLEFGLRYDRQFSSIRGREPNNDIFINELNFQNITAAIGLMKEWDGGHSLRFNLGSAWRPPNISELYSFGKHQNAIEYGLWRYQWSDTGVLKAGGVYPSEDFEVTPETGFKAILTYAKEWSGGQLEAAVYGNLIKNYLYNRPAGMTNTVRGAFPYFVFDQHDALFSGVDLDLFIQHSPRLSSTMSGSFLYAREIENHSFFVGLPPANLRHSFAWERQFSQKSSIEMSLDNQWVFSQWLAPDVIRPSAILEGYVAGEDIVDATTDNFDITAAPTGYLLTGLNTTIRWTFFSCTLRIDNLLNQSYRVYTDRLRYFADQPGRNFSISLTYRP
ncbi:MAG: iron complex outermembrane receptor protein [Cyclobacteriaceae bacterium]|jgi:iron complex outermembrane receptor protein